MDTWMQIAFALKQDKIIKQKVAAGLLNIFTVGGKATLDFHIAWKQPLNNIGFVVR